MSTGKEKATEQVVGGNFVEYGGCFGHDASVRVVNMNTNETIGSLVGHRDSVTGVFLNNKNPLQLFTYSLDGTIRLWDYEDAILLDTYSIGVPIHHCVQDKKGDCFYLTHSKGASSKRHRKSSKPETDRKGDKKQKKDAVRWSVVSWSPATKTLKLLMKVPNLTAFCATANSDHLIAAAGKELYIYNTRSGALKQLSHSRSIKVLAAHPSEKLFLSGEKNGCVTIWRNFDDVSGKPPVLTERHWHSLGVRALAFTADGNMFLSGGIESTLVIWQLESGQKQFLPRLGLAPISHVAASPTGTHFAVTSRDNSVRFFNAISLTLEFAYSGLRNANNPRFQPETGLVPEPGTGHLVMNGLEGTATLQFYDPERDRVVRDVEVEPQQTLLKTDEKELKVMRVAFSGDGSWMATVDAFFSQKERFSQNLKFWLRASAAEGFVLNTVVPDPHEKRITALAYMSHITLIDADLVATLSTDAIFKMWESEVAWTLRSVGEYRGEVPHAAAFSPDGSLFAISFGPAVTLWDPYTLAFKARLTFTCPTAPILWVGFAAKSPHLVASSGEHVIVWDLLSLRVWWSLHLRTRFLAFDPLSPAFSVIAAECLIHHAAEASKDGKRREFLISFSSASPSPTFAAPVPPYRGVRALSYLPPFPSEGNNQTTPESRLAYLTSSNSIVIVQRKQQGGEEAGEKKRKRKWSEQMEKAKAKVDGQREREQLVGLYAAVFGSFAPAPSPAEAAAKRPISGAPLVPAHSTLLLDLLEGPSHLLPPITELYEPLMDRFLQKADAPAAPPEKLEGCITVTTSAEDGAMQVEAPQQQDLEASPLSDKAMVLLRAAFEEAMEQQ